MEKGKESKKIINIDLEDDDSENNTNDANQDVSASADVDLNDDIEPNNSNSKTSPENGASNTTNKKKKMTKALKDILTSNSTKFMSNFDPELSNRERRKLNRKFNVDGKKNALGLDDNGFSNGLEKDICDCLIEGCPGCHFPCPKCRTCKCATECRVNRKWIYEAVENETELAKKKGYLSN